MTHGAPETMTLADLRVGDWVEEIPTQGRIRGTRPQASVIGKREHYRWTRVERRPGRRRLSRVQVAGYLITFAMSQGEIDLPGDFTCTARRAS